MEQLLYRSRAVDGLVAGEVFRIIEGSARDNPARDLTGFLIYAQDCFIQYLEGPHASLDLLLNELERDRRHHSIEVVYRSRASERFCPGWRMQRIDFAPGKVAETLNQFREKRIPAEVVSLVAQMLEPGRKAA